MWYVGGMKRVLLVVVFGALVGAAAYTYPRWEGLAPAITITPDITTVGRHPSIALVVADGGAGLRHVSVRLRQGDRDAVLADDTLTGAEHTYDVGALIEEAGGLAEGTAALSVTATDRALRRLGRGNEATVTKSFTVDVTPPRLVFDPVLHYINQGGSECVTYTVDDDPLEGLIHGVQVGSNFFPGIGNGDTWSALFALAYDQPADTPIRLVARDAAGNETAVDMPYRVTPKTFRSRTIELDDAFLNKVVTEIMSHTPSVREQGSLVQTYVEINSNLRRANHAAIAELAKQSAQDFLWDGAFVQLSNSQVEAAFADHRAYVYAGEVVDRQDHVGFDLSVVARTPVEAGNTGRVVLAEYFGIYGNTVIIDHGAGLLSLYGHLSQIDVRLGQDVTKGEIVGRSGATGLAGGDHLHFGLFLDGVPVNPLEWWDARWVRDHVLARLPAFGPGY